MGNLADVMLVFACGLITALVSAGLELPRQPSGPPSPDAPAPARSGAPREIERGRELPKVPRGAGAAGDGYEAVGRVYRDSKTGKLILIGD